MTGYRQSVSRQLVACLLTLLSGGALLLVFRWRPSWRLAVTCSQASLARYVTSSLLLLLFLFLSRADRVLIRHTASGSTTVEVVVEEEVRWGKGR